MINNHSKTYVSTVIVAIALASMLVVAPMFGMAQAAKPTGTGGNAHFVGQPKVTANSDHSITASFKIAGLQAGQIITATLSASSISVTGQCINPGGNSPPPKTFSLPGASASEQIGPTDKNGNLVGSVTLFPPSQAQIEAAADCPNPNWDVQVQSIVYNGVVLTVQTQQGTLTKSFGTVPA